MRRLFITLLNISPVYYCKSSLLKGIELNQTIMYCLDLILLKVKKPVFILDRRFNFRIKKTKHERENLML